MALGHATYSNAMQPAPTVSFDDEPLVLVNEADEEVGFETKQRCHDGDGLLHRAFSVFLFSPDGDVLLQQRSGQKRLWPGAWSNTCCFSFAKSTVSSAVTLSARESRRSTEAICTRPASRK